MFPYIPHPTLDLGFYRVEAFTVLALIAIIVQFQIVLRRAPSVGIERATASTLLAWAIGLGLVSAHVFDVLVYTPERLAQDPLILFKVWDSLSSFGGMLGGLLGIFIVMRWKQMTTGDIWRFFDLLLYALPFTLAIGRLGCALQHDHPGVSSSHWLAVQFPEGPRFDLGLLEFFYCTLLATTFWTLGRRRWPDGLYIGLFFALYGPVRFAMDTLRISEARYLGWTPGQYASILATIVGLAVLAAVFRSPADGVELDPSG